MNESQNLSAVNEEVGKYLNRNFRNFVIDLSSVNFINSSGLGVLMAASTTIRNRKGSLKFSSPTEKVKSVLLITGLKDIFEIYKTTIQAIQSFTKKEELV